MNVDTSAVKNIVEAEGYKGKEYSLMFNNIIIFMTAAISTIQENNKPT
jgi:hypothetical protein